MLLQAFPILFALLSAASALTEPERVEGFYARNYTWPPVFKPNTPGWSKLFKERLEQVHEIDDLDRRYEGYMQAISPGVVAPNFTEWGFGLTRAPEDLMEDLRNAIRDGLANGDARLEGKVEVIDGPYEPLFIDRPDLTERVLRELHPYVEAWAGIEVAPHTAYGLRLYQNQSALWAHVDKVQTHILSFILHIDKSDDAEDWPIFIEDFDGNTHEISLTSGDMVFYESSKCTHGRPRRLNASWYSSIFVHYYPKNGWTSVNHELESHYAIPPHWSDPVKPEDKKYTPLTMEGTSFREKECPDDWCLTQNTIKWSGPGQEGFWIDPKFKKHPLNVKTKDVVVEPTMRSNVAAE